MKTNAKRIAALFFAFCLPILHTPRSFARETEAAISSGGAIFDEIHNESGEIHGEDLPAEPLQEDAETETESGEGEEDSSVTELPAASADGITTPALRATPPREGNETGVAGIALLSEEQEEPPVEEPPVEEPPVADIVYDEDELYDWLYEHSDIGGTVELGGDIFVEGNIGPLSGAPIVINTKQYGFIIQEGTLYDFEGSLHITGEGVDVPVVELREAGWIWMQNWNSVLHDLKITATGRNGIGGCALRVSDIDDKAIDTNLLREYGHIRSYGSGAVGIEFTVPADAYGFRVSVEGENSVAVRGAEGVNLFFCRLDALGQNAAVAEGGLTLNNCLAEPEPTGVKIINRHIEDVSGGRFYLPCKQGNNTLDLTIDIFYRDFSFILKGDNETSSMNLTIGVDWNASLYELDTNVLGKITFPGTLNPFFQDFGLGDSVPIAMTVDVRDPDIPCISQMKFYEDYVTLFFWKEYDPDEDGVILWRSDDGGESWRDCTRDADIQWHDGQVSFYFDEIISPVQFLIEETGVGESNVVTLYRKDGNVNCGFGGDRTGTDRNGANGGDLGSDKDLEGGDRTGADRDGEKGGGSGSNTAPSKGNYASSGAIQGDGNGSGGGMITGSNTGGETYMAEAAPGIGGATPDEGAPDEGAPKAIVAEVIIEEAVELPFISVPLSAGGGAMAVFAQNRGIVTGGAESYFSALITEAAADSVEETNITKEIIAEQNPMAAILPEQPLPADPFDTEAAMLIAASAAALLGAALLFRRIRPLRR